MSRLVVMGYELPALAAGAIEARSYRTLQVVEPLLADGHAVCLVVSHVRDESDVPHRLGPALHYQRLNMRTRGWRARLGRLIAAFQPQGLVAVMFNSALRATRLRPGCPIWMDLYGDRLAETQVAQHAQGHTRGFRTSLRYQRLVLEGGDVYSACGTPQKHALIGQLGTAGRLNRATFGYDFAHAILPGAAKPDDDLERPALPPGLPENAFVALWCGGYNVWTDVSTLYQGLNDAMASEPGIHFLSLGAGVRLARNDSYERFQALVADSPHRARFHLLGWRPVREVPGYYRRAQVGLNLDARHYETELGTRTRIVDMLRHGLPVITTLGCELSAIVAAKGLGLAFAIGDAGRLRDHLLALARDEQTRRQMAARAQPYATEQLSFAETTRPLRAWASRPYFAPDRRPGQAGPGLERLTNRLRYWVRRWLWDWWALEPGE